MFDLRGIFKKKFKDNELFIGIFLKEQEGIVFYLQKQGAGLTILQEEHFVYSSGWEHLTDDVDEVLYRLEQKTRLTPNKTIIFIYSHLIDPVTHQIKKPYLVKIKEISKNLELTPLGYIECHEAVIDYLRRKSPYNLQALLIEFDKTLVTVIQYQSGKLSFQKTVPRTGNVAECVGPVFEQIKNEFGSLPTKLVIYNVAALKKEASEFTSHVWNKSLFETRPSIEIVSDHDLHTHLIELFGKQVLTDDANLGGAPPLHQPESVATPPQQAATIINHEEEDDFDFDDVEIKEEQKESTPSKQVEGFVIGGEEDDEGVGEIFSPNAFNHEKEDIFAKQEEQSPSKSKVVNTVVNRFTIFMKGMMGRMQNAFKIVRANGGGNQKLFILGGALVLVALFAVEYFFHKATVRVMMPSQEVVKTITVGDELPLDASEDVASFNAQTEVTGQKNIGEKAKGGVTVYNSSLAEGKTLTKGSKITAASGGLKFILADDIKVASASGDASSITSSTAKGNVLAEEIGPEYNLAAGSKFAITGESASTVIAKNDSTFTGGTKKQVKVVSAADIINLKSNVQKQVDEYVKKVVRTKVEGDENVVPQLTSFKLAQEDYTKDEGEEADSTRLSAKAAITYMTYNTQRAKDIFKSELSKGLGEGLSIDESSISHSLKDVKKVKSDTTLQFGLVARAITKIDESSIQSALKGKKASSIESFLTSNFKAKGYELVATPNVPLLSSWLPFFKSNLKVEIVY